MSRTSKQDLPRDNVQHVGHAVLGRPASSLTPADTLHRLPTAEEYKQLWEVLAEFEEFGLDVVYTAAMDGAHAMYGAQKASLPFDRSTITWENVGRLALFVSDTRSHAEHILKRLGEISATVSYLQEVLWHGGDGEMGWPPPYNRYGGDYEAAAYEPHSAEAAA